MKANAEMSGTWYQRALHALVVAGLGALAPIGALANGVIGALHYAEVKGEQGAEVELGYRWRWDAWSVSVSPLGGFIVRDTEDRYRTEIVPENNETCRDSTTGQLVDKSYCSSRFTYAGSIYGEWMAVSNLHIGAGVRYGSNAGAFATIRFQVNRVGSIQARGGKDYTAIGVGIEF